MISHFTLNKKINLTPDVYWLQFIPNGSVKAPIEGQFLTFLLPKSGGRAYSILNYDGKHFEFIIKRLESGRWGSKEICDLSIGEEIKWIWPSGHFVLKETPKNKLFLGTGTWFAPLYFQILWASQKELKCDLKFVFWVREQKDMFYEKELERITHHHPNFSYEIYLSQEKLENYNFWRITSFISKDSIQGFEEFYICGSPSMVEDAERLLLENGAHTEQIFTEKY